VQQLRCLGVVLLGLAGAVRAAEAPAVPDAAESAYLTRDFLFVDAPQIENYLRDLAQRLLWAHGDGRSSRLAVPRILLFSSEALDVFTDARHNLLISTGTLRLLDSEDELAAVLGHELSHQLLRHPQQKDSLRAFPVGIDTLAAISTVARGGNAATSPELAAFGDQKLANMQAANLLWSDLVAPAWNRKQERAADINGFELMRNAGYDPSAFGSLFQKLGSAAAKRSERMQLLKKVLLARASQQKAASRSNSDALAKQLQSGMTEAAVEAGVAGLSTFNRDYDSPDERQKQLASFAGEHRLLKRPSPAVSHFKSTLRQGAGANLLALDAAAIGTLAALTAGNKPAAEKAVRVLLPAGADGRLASPHLNLALGAWYHASGRPDLGERRARAWLAGKRPPAQGFVWEAYYQATRREWQPAIATLESGRKRVGNSAPFLPHLVSLARAAGQNEVAENYTRDCGKEDRKNAGAMVTSFLRPDALPSGLYADCVRRLGHEPPGSDAKNLVLKTLRTPVQAGKSLTDKLRDKLHRD
jgi:predicted Zn-dependent protease